MENKFQITPGLFIVMRCPFQIWPGMSNIVLCYVDEIFPVELIQPAVNIGAIEAREATKEEKAFMRKKMKNENITAIDYKSFAKHLINQ